MSLHEHFQELSKLLDAKNDKYEAIYKCSRDVTQKCKKIIFSLQRIPGLDKEAADKILKTTSAELQEVEQTMFADIALELRGRDTYQFLNAYTGGLQEYIEAASFHHFLVTDDVLTYSQIKRKLTFSNVLMEDEDHHIPLSLPVPQKEHMLGLGDLTGELMRFCIRSISAGNFDMCYKICDVLKRINMGFISLGYISARDVQHKVITFRSSLGKVEEACYSLQLRKTELPPEMLAGLLSVMENEEENAGSTHL